MNAVLKKPRRHQEFCEYCKRWFPTELFHECEEFYEDGLCGIRYCPDCCRLFCDICSQCGMIFCKDHEAVLECQCGAKLCSICTEMISNTNIPCCPKCSSKCEICEDLLFRNDVDLRMCNNFYKYYFLYNCVKCGRQICTECSYPFNINEDDDLEELFDGTKERYCEECFDICDECDQVFDKTDEGFECRCGTKLCIDCTEMISNSNIPCCPKCSSKCAICGELYFRNDLDLRKGESFLNTLFLSHCVTCGRQICHRCSQPTHEDTEDTKRCCKNCATKVPKRKKKKINH